MSQWSGQKARSTSLTKESLFKESLMRESLMTVISVIGLMIYSLSNPTRKRGTDNPSLACLLLWSQPDA